MERKLGTYRQYSPPVGIPEYVKKALPPRPDSGSSSIYSSPNESSQLPVQNDKRQDVSPTSVLNEARLTMVQPLQLIASSSPRSEKRPDIAAPQPRHPARMILETSEADDMIISPVSNPLSVNTNLQQYEVSPISPNESACSLHSAISSTASPNSSSAEEIYLSRRPFVYEEHPIVYPSVDLLSTPEILAPSQKHQFQYQQINLRYSDPGSPINGAVIHPPTSFPSDPNLRLSRHLDDDNQRHTPAMNTNPPLQPADSEDNNVDDASSTPVESVVSPKVAFAGTIDGFSTRPRANSKRTAPVPPPLKLSERPFADQYVKTPFPGAAEPAQRQETSGPSTSRQQNQQQSGGAEHKTQEEQNSIARKRNRMSTLPALVFPKSLRHNGGEKDKDKERDGGKVKKSLLSRAKSLRIGRGLGLGIGSEEARKEKRREEMKRQIRIGEPRS
ncbi:hypothetical protein Daesc_010116 [Daldinia eschscholtzii]|uniref:Uncharacterized protein n=1 Tax=Daldinia eschscholtzii TaxID=292717 RepID=A0AAX6M6U7_9PEZI